MSDHIRFQDQSRCKLLEPLVREALVEFVSRRFDFPCACGEFRADIYWSLHEADVYLVHAPGCDYYVQGSAVPEPIENPIDQAIEQRRSESQGVPIIDETEAEIDSLRDEIARLNARFLSLRGPE